MTPDTSVARFTHDCSHCTFLGQFQEDDLYVCAGRDATVIARFSSDGPDYSSGKCFSYGSNPKLTEARLRAQAQGILSYDLEEAMFHTNKLTADEATYAELREQLKTSEIGGILALFAEDAAKAHADMRAFITRGTEAYQAKFADRTAGELRVWVCGHVQRAWDWAGAFSLPRPHEDAFMKAVYLP